MKEYALTLNTLTLNAAKYNNLR